MYTLDATIFVHDASPGDPDHETCHALMAQLYQRNTIGIPRTFITPATRWQRKLQLYHERSIEHKFVIC